MKSKNTLYFILILIGAAVLIAINAVGIISFGGNGGRIWGIANIRQGLDLKGGVSILYEADIENPSPSDINAAQELMRNRLDRRGYLEADVMLEGPGQIRVDIPGVADAEAAIAEIGATALLTFQNEERQVFLTGAHVTSARRVTDRESGVSVSISFDAEGARLFEQFTRENIGRTTRIYMDDELISQPYVREAITDGSARISGGNMTPESALELATKIEQGSLPFGLNTISTNRIGARLGADALRTSIIAGAIGLFLVLIFMIIIYRSMGICADIALIIYVSIILFLISALKITLSLPGIAGLILSIGMATDANIVIFERIREEIALGKSLRSAMRTGYKRALPAIIDSNVTTLLAGIVLYWLGTGPIMGFAQMLIIGILVSMFTCVIITRVITTAFLEMGIVKVSVKPEQTEETAFRPIVEKRKIFFASSAAVIAIGAAVMLYNHSNDKGVFNLDVEFSGGTSFVVDIGQPFENADIEEIVRSVTGESAPQIQHILDTNEVMIRTTLADTEIRLGLIARLSERYDLNPDDFNYSDVSPAVSDAMRRSAIIAITVASLGMLAYISIRFRDFRTGASAVIALLHDTLILLCIYGILRIPLNYAFIAVMLTTLGYSINATIIIFDRIRENRVRMPKAPLSTLINTSVTQTLRRTLFSTLSSFIAVFMLYVIGVAAIRDFTLPIMAGLLFGAYSSVCLSGSVWFMMSKGKNA